MLVRASILTQAFRNCSFHKPEPGSDLIPNPSCIAPDFPSYNECASVSTARFPGSSVECETRFGLLLKDGETIVT
jgi:hypothetical protein